MRKIEKFMKCHGPNFDFNVAVVGTGKNPEVYFFEADVYYNGDDFDAPELPFKVGTPAKYIGEWFLQMDLKTLKKISGLLK